MFFLFLLICLLLVIGACLIVVGFLWKSKKKLRSTGLIICCVPLAFLAISSILITLFDFLKHKPDRAELVGEYQITEVTNLKFDKATYDHYKLVLKADSTFSLTATPYVTICDTGRYELDYSFSGNELAFQCGRGYHLVHLERRFGGFRIEFISGDPDSEQSIYFEKKKSKN